MKNGVETDKCQKCAFSWDKLVDNKCVCSAITDCDVCSSATVCVKCKGNKLINIVGDAYSCVDTCPANTH